MNNRIVLIGLILLISAANAEPGGPLPAAYNGFVTIDGKLATSATVQVYDSAGKMPPQESLFDSGSYSVRVVWDDPSTPSIDGIFTGETITFRVNGITAATWTVSEADRMNTRINLEITTSPAPASPGSSSSGGGGGGGASGENFSNIETKEKYGLHIFKDMVTSYRFTDSKNPIMFINITGNINAGETDTAVEVLKSTSALVKTPAPGKVYKNLNVWVGTSGFAVPKNIKEAVIKFRVQNAWITSGGFKDTDIVLSRWDGTRWSSLETVPGDKDGAFTYFEAKTTAFSQFAISGMKSEAENTAPPAGAQTPTEPTSQGSAGTKNTPGFDLVAAVAAFLAILVMRERMVK